MKKNLDHLTHIQRSRGKKFHKGNISHRGSFLQQLGWRSTYKTYGTDRMYCQISTHGIPNTWTEKGKEKSTQTYFVNPSEGNRLVLLKQNPGTAGLTVCWNINNRFCLRNLQSKNWHFLKISGKKNRNWKVKVSKFKFESFATFVWRGDFTSLSFEGLKDMCKIVKLRVLCRRSKKEPRYRWLRWRKVHLVLRRLLMLMMMRMMMMRMRMMMMRRRMRMTDVISPGCMTLFSHCN